MTRYILLLFFFFFSSVSSVIAATGDSDPSAQISCGTIFSIDGPEAVKIGSTHEFTISAGTGTTEFSGSIVYTLRRDNKVVETKTDTTNYLRNFKTPGEVVLEARLSASGPICEGIITKKIRVYERVLIYVGVERVGVETGMRSIFEKNNILYQSYTGKNSISSSEESKNIWNSIDQSDIFAVGSTDILAFFSDIVKLQKSKQINFSNKNIYIVSDFSRSFLSKVLASSLSQIGATRVFLISEDQFYGLMTRISAGEDNIVDIGQELSYEKSKTVYSLSGFLEFLTYAGFSYQLLAFLLSLTLIVLVLNILRQIVGFNVFGIHYPILFAVTITSLGASGTLVFMIIGFLSIVSVNLFSKKVHLLLHAKRAILISLYIVFFLFALGIDNYFELRMVRYAIFDNTLIIFPIFTTIILADKIFQEDIDILSRVGIFDLIQYGVITGVIYFLLEYKTLQYFLISYPDSIILVVVLNILVGRYMGLQLFEYFRFAPLLRKLNEEE